MALFTQSFTIINNSDCTLTLDLNGSSGLGNGNWPALVNPKTTAGPFQQTGNFDVNPTAVYLMQGETSVTNAYLHFYCAGVDPALHVNMTLKFSPSTPCSGSSIAENNTSHGKSYTTNNTTLNISTTGIGTSTGSAVFTICG